MRDFTLPVRTDARRQRQLWPLETVRPDSLYDVVSDRGEVLADGLPLGDARRFRDSCRNGRQPISASVRPAKPERHNRKSDPSEADIATLTAQIRSAWSPHVERDRRIWSVSPWHVPHCLDR